MIIYQIRKKEAVMNIKDMLFYLFVLFLNIIVFLFYDTKNDYLAVVFAAIISMNALIIPMGVVLLFDSILLRNKNRFNGVNSHFKNISVFPTFLFSFTSMI